MYVTHRTQPRNEPPPAAYFRQIMPSAQTMLAHYQHQVRVSRGAGLAGLAEQARLSGTIRALIDVVNEDHDPRNAQS